jgi:hypothetical protein
MFSSAPSGISIKPHPQSLFWLQKTATLPINSLSALARYISRSVDSGEMSRGFKVPVRAMEQGFGVEFT